jgi:hypothetical protein
LIRDVDEATWRICISLAVPPKQDRPCQHSDLFPEFLTPRESIEDNLLGQKHLLKYGCGLRALIFRKRVSAIGAHKICILVRDESFELHLSHEGGFLVIATPDGSKDLLARVWQLRLSDELGELVASSDLGELTQYLGIIRRVHFVSTRQMLRIVVRGGNALHSTLLVCSPADGRAGEI